MPDPKPFYITTPIYYVNGRPHIGHAYTTIAADVAARFQRARGRAAFLQTGTDEHGQKVLEKAVSRGMSPKEHADDMVDRWWRPMMDKLSVEPSHFMRTTDPAHAAFVQRCLQQLHDAGELYLDTYEGWYSPSAERFWTEKDLVNGKCPDTGQPVERVQESNWFFKMSAYQQRLIDHIEANPGFIQPVSRRNEVLGYLRKDLGDLCITRPKARMSWGIEIPFDADYVTYVWFDALLNYVSHVSERAKADPTLADAWPADFQLIGKDILATHAVYWSTMLMALGLPLPKTIYAHGWWLSGDGSKMSKSLGNVIDVDLLVDGFGVDALRYFLLRDIAFGADGTFTYEGFLTRYNADLANDLGNLAHRALSMTTNWLGGVVPPRGPGVADEDALVELGRKAAATFARELDALHFQDALDAVWELVRAGNKYVDTTAPWALNKAGQGEALGTVLRTVLELSALVAALLRPVMPERMGTLLERLGVADADAVLRRAIDGDVFDALGDGAALTVGDPLFPRIKDMPPAIAALFAEPATAAEVPAKKKSKKASAAPPAEVTYADFQKLALRVGEVVSAAPHPDADRLLVLQVHIGEPEPRQIVAGIASVYAPDALVGRKVVVVANLAPAEIRGVQSQGMILAAGGKAVVDLVGVDAPVGEVVR